MYGYKLSCVSIPTFLWYKETQSARRKKIMPICEVCNSVYCVKPYREGHSRWCSRKCRNKKIIKYCLNCGKIILAPKIKLGSKPRRYDYCSSKCWSSSKEGKAITVPMLRNNWSGCFGKDNPNWQGGITAISRRRLNHNAWRKLSKQVIALYGNKCAVCGSKKGLVAHHKIAWIEGGTDTLDNLVALCNKCHPKIENDSKARRAIERYCKKRCLDEIPNCTDKGCPLYQYRPFSGLRRRPITLKTAAKA
jgi:hypothetical protein